MMPAPPPRVAVVSDLREEQWHSMDLVAEMLLLNLRSPDLSVVEPTQLRPHMIRRASRLPWVGQARLADSADRVLNRFWDYPRWLAPMRHDFDVFHIVDHSYAHLALNLPVGRAIVTCHDLDAFRGVLPGHDGGSVTDRVIGGRLLQGLRAAARIVCVSEATRAHLLSFGAVRADRVTVVPNGVHPSCRERPDPSADREASSILGPPEPDCAQLLHVGSSVPRKRIDVLLEVVASLRAGARDVRLVRVGAPFTAAQQRQVRQLGLDESVTVLPFVDRRLLAALYRRATLVLQPSEREGFGLPVAEAMACGTPVVASRVPALAEVGGDAATYCRVGDVSAWSATVADLLDERARCPEQWRQRRVAGIAHSRRFSWREHARQMGELYHEVLAQPAGAETRSLRALQTVTR
jgi:glycosyltransferase involved in cell wall biosynthesis